MNRRAFLKPFLDLQHKCNNVRFVCFSRLVFFIGLKIKLNGRLPVKVGGCWLFTLLVCLLEIAYKIITRFCNALICSILQNLKL